MKKLFLILSSCLLVLGLLGGQVIARDKPAWVQSIATPNIGKGLYQVLISRIDGEMARGGPTYRLEPGKHTVTVTIETTGAALITRPESQLYLDIEIDAEAGVTYTLAGQADPDASSEAIRKGEFWKPVITMTRGKKEKQ